MLTPEREEAAAQDTRGLILRVGSIIGLGQLSFAIVIPLLPLYLTEQLNASVKLVGLVISTFAIVETIFKTAWGSVADRLGRRPIIVLGLAVSSLAPLIMPHLRAAWLFVPLRFLDGVGSAALWPTAAAIMADLTPPSQRATAMGTLNMFFLAGLALGPAVGLYVSGLTGSHIIGFYLSALLLMVSAATARTTLPRFPARHASVGGAASADPGAADAAPEGDPPHGFRGLMEILRERRSSLRLLLAIAFIQMFGVGVLAPILPIYAKYIVGLEEEIIGTVFLILVLSVALASLPAGRLADRFGKRRLLFAGMLLGSVGMWMMAGPPHLAVVTPAAIMLGAGYALSSPAWLALVSQMAPPGRVGLAMGASETAQGLGIVLGPLLGGVLWDHLDYRAPFILCAALLTLAALLAVPILIRSGPPPAAPAAPGASP
ncbi:MAG: MFS transporter [Armatimonadetes bacterium]|nr:MFS transporter [Armatimonadota bacterium]